MEDNVWFPNLLNLRRHGLNLDFALLSLLFAFLGILGLDLLLSLLGLRWLDFNWHWELLLLGLKPGSARSGNLKGRPPVFKGPCDVNVE